MTASTPGKRSGEFLDVSSDAVKLPQLDPDDVRAFRKRHLLRQPDLARLLGLSENTIARWEGGSRTIPPYLALALEALEELYIVQFIAREYTPAEHLARLKQKKLEKDMPQ